MTGCSPAVSAPRPALLATVPQALSALLLGFGLLYGAAAARLGSTMLGTLAVWWAMSSLGFFIAVFPHLTVVGFRGGMARPFAAALALILLFLPFKAGAGRGGGPVC